MVGKTAVYIIKNRIKDGSILSARVKGL